MGAFVTVIVVLLLIFVGGPLLLSFLAHQQTDLTVPVPANQVADEVESVMNGMWWSDVYGEGTLNYRAKGLGISSMYFNTKPVLSIALTDQGQAGTGVSIWMSEYGSAWGQVGMCDRVVFKRRKLLKRLRAMQPVMGVAPAAGPAGSQGASFHAGPHQGPLPSPAPQAQAAPGYGFGAPSAASASGGAPGNAGGTPTPTFGPGAGRPGGGAHAQYGAPAQHGGPAQYGAPAQHGAPAQYEPQHGGPSRYGPPPQYGPPPGGYPPRR